MPKYIPADGPSKPVETAEQSTSPNKAGKQKHVGHALPAGQVMLRREQLAVALGVSKRLVDYWRQARVIPSYKPSRVVLFAMPEVMAALAAFRVASVNDGEVR
jgi:hypothetical protein